MASSLRKATGRNLQGVYGPDEGQCRIMIQFLNMQGALDGLRNAAHETCKVRTP
jgi:hypothetical protein